MKINKQGVRDLNPKQRNTRKVDPEDGCFHEYEHANSSCYCRHRVLGFEDLACIFYCKKCGTLRP